MAGLNLGVGDYTPPTSIISAHTPWSGYEGVQATLTRSMELINATWAHGMASRNDLLLALDNTIAAIETTPTGDITGGTVTSSAVTEPTVTLSDTDPTDVYAAFGDQYNDLVSKVATFNATYFPDEKVFYGQAEDWLQTALADPSGLPASVRAQLLGDAQATILTESNRAKDAVLATFATRRMPMPGGQAASAVLQIEQGAQDKMAEAGRNITKLSVEQLRFVVDKALACRTIAMESVARYIGTLASSASGVTSAGYDAKSKAINSAVQYYQARIAAAEQINKVSQFNVGTELDAASKNQAAEMHDMDTMLKAMVTSAQSLGQLASASLNNLHASAGTSYSVSA